MTAAQLRETACRYRRMAAEAANLAHEQRAAGADPTLHEDQDQLALTEAVACEEDAGRLEKATGFRG